MTVQSKLLRMLQEQEFRPLGSTKSRTIDVKIIAATNADLRYLVEARQFREDLFYRLNVLSITLPPLRDRKEDILLLASHSLNVYAKEFGKKKLTLGHTAKAKLMGHTWPGNVRELQGVIQRAVAMGSGDTLEAHDLDLPEYQKSELKIPTTAYDAEFGQASQGVIAVTTRAGTNDLHGGGFWYRRDSNGAARDPFARIPQ